MEQVPFLGRKGLEGRVVCGVVCGREGEKERRRGRGRREREKERKGSLSLFQSISSPAGLIPHGTLQTLSKHSPNTLPLNPYPSNPDPKWGIPTSSPPGEREEKEEEKGTFYTYYPLFFSLGENPQTPLLTGTRKKKTRKARARVNLTSRTKSIDLNETS